MISSPLTGGATQLAALFDAAEIVACYERDGFDVRRYYEGMEKAELWRCVDTGYRFFHPPSLAGEADFYSQIYDPAKGQVDSYREWGEDYQFVFERLIPGERLLDIGCGYGNFLIRAAEVADVMGIDGNVHAAERCAANGLKVLTGTTQDFLGEYAGSFDTVTMFQVLEHVYDVGSFLNAALAMVKPKGRLVISVPHGEPYSDRFIKYSTWGLPPHHVGFWDTPALKALEAHFPLKLDDMGYQYTSDRWLLDAYYRSRCWFDITTQLHQHSFIENVKILFGATLSVPLSLYDNLSRKGPLVRNCVTMIFQKTA